MQNNLGIAGRLENRPVALQIAPQFRRVCDITVVRNRDLPFIAFNRKWLRIPQHCVAGSRVTGMADGKFPRQAVHHAWRKNIGHMSHVFVAISPAPIARADSCALLAPMLQCVKAQISEIGCLRMSVDRHHSAFVVKLIRPYVHVDLKDARENFPKVASTRRSRSRSPICSGC